MGKTQSAENEMIVLLDWQPVYGEKKQPYQSNTEPGKKTQTPATGGRRVKMTAVCMAGNWIRAKIANGKLTIAWAQELSMGIDKKEVTAKDIDGIVAEFLELRRMI